MMAIQQLQEEVDRSIKLSRTNTMNSTEFTIGDTDRAGKVFGFDSVGELVVTQELGTFKGNWSASTTYAVRDIVKDTSTNNIFLCKTAHTSSGSQPLTTNTDSAKWDLLVDAESATASALAAAVSATAASTSETNAATSASTATTKASEASTSASNASTSETNAATSATNSANSATASASSASAAAATFDLFDDAYLGAKATNPTLDNDGDALQDGALYFDTTNDVMKVYDLGTTTWYQLTPTVSNQTNINAVNANSANINAVAANENNINNVNSNSANINTTAGISSDVTSVASNSAAIVAVNNNETNINAVNANSANINLVASNNTNVTNVGTNIASITTAATNLADINAFANIYLGPSASAPTLDPDGSALDVGDLYFDTVSQTMKVYSSSGWIPAGSSVNGTSSRFTYTVSSSTTTITGADDNTNTLAYDAGFVDVYLNGVKMVNGTDVTVTSGTSIVFSSAIGTVGTDVVDIIAFGTFQLSNFSINDANDVSTGGISDGQVLVYNSSASAFQPGNASSAEVYGFSKNASGELIITTTNGGVDDISDTTYASFDDVLFSASGFTFSINNDGNLVATI